MVIGALPLKAALLSLTLSPLAGVIAAVPADDELESAS